MELHQFRTDGSVDVTSLELRDAARCRLTALAICANPGVTGVYRCQFVDEAYGRVAWDSYEAMTEPKIGAPVGFSTLVEAQVHAARMAAA